MEEELTQNINYGTTPHGKRDILVESYLIFNQLLSTTGKLGITINIRRRVLELEKRYNLSKNDLLHTIYKNYLEKRCFEKYEISKSTLFTYLVNITLRQLQYIARQFRNTYDGCEMISWDEFYADPDDEEKRLGDSLSIWERRGHAALANRITPEDDTSALELKNLMRSHYGDFDTDVLCDVLDRETAATELDIPYDTYIKRLQRKTKNFLPILSAAGFNC